MLMVLFSWVVILCAAYIFGRAIADRVYRKDRGTLGRTDVYLMTGLIFLTVYAQLFSLFYKVAGIACTILGAFGILLVLWYVAGHIRRKEYLPCSGYLRRHPYRVAALLLCAAVTMVWTVQQPGHYDTGLYHAQAIRWIEEYGAVKGLGNLHMRLAYNSSFMSLQALFSLQWLLGQSLHTLNGFFCVFCLGYVVMTIRIEKNGMWKTSDLLKCAAVIYIVSARHTISSSGTDIWAMLLVLYVCIKWCEFAEGRVESSAPWCYVCLVGVYAVTVKLSSALIVLLTVYPMYLLIRKRDVKQLLANAAAASAIVLPFLIRNVILSGYLIYPAAGIDLFHVDWKMDQAELIKDSLDIKMFGRGFSSAGEYDASLLGWIPGWFGKQEPAYQLLILVGTVGACAAACRLIWYIRERWLREIVFTAVNLAGLIFWLMMAPLVRYGMVYFLIVTAIAAGGAGEPRRRRKYEREEKVTRAVNILLLFLMVPLLGVYVGRVEKLSELEPEYLIRQMDYLSWQSTQHQVGNVTIWVPDEGDLCGYFAFPATPRKGQLKVLALRGDGLGDGFLFVPEVEE